MQYEMFFLNILLFPTFFTFSNQNGLKRVNVKNKNYFQNKYVLQK